MYCQLPTLLLLSSLAMQTIAVPLQSRQAVSCDVIKETGLNDAVVDLLKSQCETMATLFMKGASSGGSQGQGNQGTQGNKGKLVANKKGNSQGATGGQGNGNGNGFVGDGNGNNQGNGGNGGNGGSGANGTGNQTLGNGVNNGQGKHRLIA